MLSIKSKSEPKRFFSAAKKNDELELLVYDSIGESFWGGGVTAKAVKDQLAEAGDVKKITVRINSPGGDVFEGAAIYSLLSQHKAKVECYVDGLAASAAFTIAMAADTIHCSEAGMMMCHNAWGGCMGYASDMRGMADLLDKVSGTMRDVYAKRCGMSADEVQKLMDAETWMTASEAVEYGFADDVISRDPKEEADAKALAASYDLSKFAKNTPPVKGGAKTKTVDGKELTKSMFAYQGSDKLEDWKLPVECPDHDAEWEKNHIRNAISRWSSTDMPDASEKSKARGRIKSAAKKYDIEVDDDSLKDSADSGDECQCDCQQCVDGDCAECSNPDCDDPNCEGCPQQEADDDNDMAKSELQLMRDRFDIASA